MKQAAPYTPGKVLDTQSTDEGDTLLTAEAIEAVADPLFDTAEQALRNYLEAAGSPENASEQARAAIVQRRLAEVAFIRAATAQLTGELDQSAAIRSLQNTLHDHYNSDLFQAALRKKIELLEHAPVSLDGEYGKAIVLDQLDVFVAASEGNDAELEQPTEATLQAVGDWLRDQFGDILDEIDAIDGDTLDAHKLQEIFTLAINTTPALSNDGWRARVIQRVKSAITVFASNREVAIPEQRQVSKAAAKRLVIHEVFGHALRSAIAEEEGNEVGVTGTARYGEFEESFEIALEQCLEGVYDPKRGLDHYISVGLAESGLPRDEHAHLTESMRQITLAKGGFTPEVIDKAKALTKNQVARTFAGLTDTEPGVTNRKDINYLHGLNGAWRLLNAITEAKQVDESMRWLLQAKFNPYTSTDRQLIDEISPMPSSIRAVLEEEGVY